MNILEEAGSVVTGDRQRDYNHPYYNFAIIAHFWSTYVKEKHKLASDFQLSREDVAHMAILMKIAREMHTTKRDNLVDIVGYARCIEMIQEKAEEIELSEYAKEVYEFASATAQASVARQLQPDGLKQ